MAVVLYLRLGNTVLSDDLLYTIIKNIDIFGESTYKVLRASSNTRSAVHINLNTLYKVY